MLPVIVTCADLCRDGLIRDCRLYRESYRAVLTAAIGGGGGDPEAGNESVPVIPATPVQPLLFLIAEYLAPFRGKISTVFRSATQQKRWE